MEKDSKIFVAGHRGLVGSAILNNLRSKGYTNFLLRTHAELDLTDQAAVNAHSKVNQISDFLSCERVLCSRAAGLCVLVGGARRRYHGEQSVPCRFYLQ